MSSEQFKEIQGLIDRMLSLGYTMEQIEGILDLDIHEETIKIQIILQTVPSNLIGEFDVNIN